MEGKDVREMSGRYEGKGEIKRGRERVKKEREGEMEWGKQREENIWR